MPLEQRVTAFQSPGYIGHPEPHWYNIGKEINIMPSYRLNRARGRFEATATLKELRG